MSALATYERAREAAASVRPVESPLRGLDGAAAWLQLKLRTKPLSRRWLMCEAKHVDRQAHALEEATEALVRERTEAVVARFVRGERDAALVREGFALSCEHARRELGERAYVVQIMGALALWHGRFIEMATGEGKTLTAALAAPLIAWRHRRLHVVTVNDYLAQRDATRHEALFARWGLSCGAVVEGLSIEVRRAGYGRHVVYGTAKRIVADWLQDAIQLRAAPGAWALSLGGGIDLLGAGRRAVIVDEADAVLIDEAVSPLILSEPRGLDAQGDVFHAADTIAQKLDVGADYRVAQGERRARLTARGRHRAMQLAERLVEPAWKSERRAVELIERALEAHACLPRGRQYEVIEGRVVIVDESTGRLLPDRSWQHGVHQAVEAKEGVAVTRDRAVLAQVSFQRFFRGSPFLSGMTGTVSESAQEMERVYGRAIVRVPTHRPVLRGRWRTLWFATREAKERAIVEEAAAVHEQKRPVLIGTRSIEASERIAQLLRARGLACEVLNALRDREEAQVIARAGQAGAITVATNMAGRGTDITLDDAAGTAGGLHVLLCEPHASKRIDRQFLGRAGRQGDPGSGRLFGCDEDELVLDHGRGVGARVARRLRGGAALVAVAQWQAERAGRRRRRGVLRQDEWADRYLPG